MVVVDSAGKSVSRLVTETCDAVLSTPICASTGSLKAGIAASFSLHPIAKQHAAK